MRILGRYEGPHVFGFAGDQFGVWDFGAKVRSAAGFRGTMQVSSPTQGVLLFAPHFQIATTLRQHRTIPALRLKHRSDGCAAAHHHYSLFIKKPPRPTSNS